MNKEEMMEYLYGEMPETHREAFEEALKKDEKAQRDLRDFANVRSMLGQSMDQPLEPIQIKLPEQSAMVKRLAGRYWWMMAASMLLVALTAGSIGMQVGSNRAENMAGTITAAGDYVSKADFEKLMQMVANQGTQLANVRGAAQSRPDENYASEVENLTRSELINLVKATIKQEQRDVEYRVASRVMEEQHAYMTGAMQDLMLYLDQQRQEDLRLINGGMQELARTVSPAQDDMVQFVNSSIQK